MHTQPHFGIGAQFGLHLPLVYLAVWPMLLTLRHTGTDHPDQSRRFGDPGSIGFVRCPIGAQGQGDAVTVLAIHQHVFVHQQVNQRQRLGKQHDDQHQPEGAGEETLGEPHRGFHEITATYLQERAMLAQ